MMRRKLLHRMKEVCGATNGMMKDELIVGEHQVVGTRLLFIFIQVKKKAFKINAKIEDVGLNED